MGKVKGVLKNLSKMLDFFKILLISSYDRKIKSSENSRDNCHYSNRSKAERNMTKRVILDWSFGPDSRLNRLSDLYGR